jgi:hypothetical protein
MDEGEAHHVVVDVGAEAAPSKILQAGFLQKKAQSSKMVRQLARSSFVRQDKPMPQSVRSTMPPTLAAAAGAKRWPSPLLGLSYQHHAELLLAKWCCLELVAQGILLSDAVCCHEANLLLRAHLRWATVRLLQCTSDTTRVFLV